MEFVSIDEGPFREIVYAVMGVAYTIQNELGRMFDEKIYRDELRYRLGKRFDDVPTEVPARTSFRGFSKVLFADLVVNGATIYELKTVVGFAANHRAQLLQ